MKKLKIIKELGSGQFGRVFLFGHNDEILAGKMIELSNLNRKDVDKYV